MWSNPITKNTQEYKGTYAAIWNLFKEILFHFYAIVFVMKSGKKTLQFSGRLAITK